MKVRPPAVAGLFYPSDPGELRMLVESYLSPSDGPAPKAIVVPHAGFVYSGPIAGTAYSRLSNAIERVVLLGPAHRVWVDGVAASTAEVFATPLGEVPVDVAARDALVAAGLASWSDPAHAPEHSLEVQLPFLQVVLDGVPVLPLLVGDASPSQVADVLEAVWGGPETLVVVSTDLSHYHDHVTAQELDRATAGAILAREETRIGPHDACGAAPLRGLLVAARRHDLDVALLDLRTSADTAGDPDRVVGYGSFALS